MPRIWNADGKAVFRSTQLAVVGGGLLFFVTGLIFQVEAVMALISPASSGLTYNDVPAAQTPTLERALAALFPALFWGLGALLMLAYFARVEVDETGIETYNLFNSMGGRLRWSEVLELRIEKPTFWRRRGPVVLVGAGRSLKISRGMVAWPVIGALMRRHMAGAILPPLPPPASRPRPVPIPAEGLTFRISSRAYTLFFGALFAALPIALAVGWPTPNTNGGQLGVALIFVPLAFSAAGVGIFLHGLNSRFFVDEDGITQFDMWGRAERLLWSEVEGYEYESTHSDEDGTITYYVLYGRESYLRLSDNVRKWLTFQNIVRAHLPANAVVDLGPSGSV